MAEKIDMGVFKWFGEGYLTYSGEIKFYIGANIEPDEDNDIYITAEEFELIAKDAERIAKELRGLTPREPDNGESAPSQPFSTPDTLFDLEGLS